MLKDLKQNKKILSNKPLRGTKDWFPEEFQIRKYIFDTWREVCTRFGYEEYLTPIVENADIYRAKSGEDAGGSELITVKREESEFAIRPEMTPSVTRLVTRIYDQAPKPIKLFSIANFMRFQKPQRGRNREFWQLNYDIFGSDSVNADIEIIQIALEIMLAFNPPKGSFILYINNRKLIDAILGEIVGIAETKKEVVRILDKWDKLTREEFANRLKEIGLSDNQIDDLDKFMSSSNSDELLQNFPELETNRGFLEITTALNELEALGYAEWIKFQPNIIRGFDYYDGMVFEVFDNSPQNNRSLFGGGRYNGLASIFGAKSFPAVGCAPGDEPIYLFLESRGLIKKIQDSAKQLRIYFPVLEDSLRITVSGLAKDIRNQGLNIATSLETQSIAKALPYADKKGYDYIVILGSNEAKQGEVVVKAMESGEQMIVKQKELGSYFCKNGAINNWALEGSNEV